jgi:hypothetical protein
LSFYAAKVRRPLVEERRHRFLGVSRVKSRAELLVFNFHHHPPKTDGADFENKSRQVS